MEDPKLNSQTPGKMSSAVVGNKLTTVVKTALSSSTVAQPAAPENPKPGLPIPGAVELGLPIPRIAPSELPTSEISKPGLPPTSILQPGLPAVENVKPEPVPLSTQEVLGSIDGKILFDLVPMLNFNDPLATENCKNHWEDHKGMYRKDLNNIPLIYGILLITYLN